MSRRRRNPAPPSWLSVVESASAAFSGTATVVSDEPVSAEQTSFRGAGHEVTAEVEIDRTLFGDAPDSPVTVEGQTSRAPESRSAPDEPRFPPDTLREVPFWDQAVPGAAQEVLVVLAYPPVVRALLGTGDDLPDAVAMIRTWTEKGAGPKAVEGDLSGSDAPHAVAFVAGFELLARSTDDLAALTDRFLGLSAIPGAAVRGILALLNRQAGQLAEAQLAAVGRRLADGFAAESDPEALVAYATWFDAHHEQVEAADESAWSDAVAAAERAASLTFDGADGDAWHQEVTRFTGALTDEA